MTGYGISKLAQLACADTIADEARDTVNITPDYLAARVGLTRGCSRLRPAESISLPSKAPKRPPLKTRMAIDVSRCRKMRQAPAQALGFTEGSAGVTSPVYFRRGQRIVPPCYKSATNGLCRLHFEASIPLTAPSKSIFPTSTPWCRR